SSRSRHTRFSRDWSSDVCSSDLVASGVVWPEACSPWLELSSQRHTTPEATNETAIGNRYTERNRPSPLTGFSSIHAHRKPMTMEIGRASWRERGDGAGPYTACDG